LNRLADVLKSKASREKELASGWKFRYIVEASRQCKADFTFYQNNDSKNFTIQPIQFMSIKVAIVEDNNGIREGLAFLIKNTSGFRCVGAHANAEIALQEFPGDWPDVILMDINLPRMSGIDCVAKVKEMRPAVHVIMLTIYVDDEKIFRSLKAGASGYLIKQTPPVEILKALSDVHAGGAPMSNAIARKVVQYFQQQKTQDETQSLSKREQEILELLAKGFQYKEIAEALSISVLTVQTHLQNIYQKLHVRSRTEAVVKYLGKNPGM
jgi:DNA-binding NarL/FixJ family response regulator